MKRGAHGSFTNAQHPRWTRRPMVDTTECLVRRQYCGVAGVLAVMESWCSVCLCGGQKAGQAGGWTKSGQKCPSVLQIEPVWELLSSCSSSSPFWPLPSCPISLEESRMEKVGRWLDGKLAQVGMCFIVIHPRKFIYLLGTQWKWYSQKYSILLYTYI